MLPLSPTTTSWTQAVMPRITSDHLSTDATFARQDRGVDRTVAVAVTMLVAVIVFLHVGMRTASQC